MHKNVQFQVRVQPELITYVHKAAEQQGIPRWEYINRVVEKITGDVAIPESPPNRKGVVSDYWTTYCRIPFIVTIPGMAELTREKRRLGYATLSAMLRDRLIEEVCADLHIAPERFPKMRRKEKGAGFAW
jgi:hypothetical protein